jgi:C-terminal processing protease CtpA/Prc
MYCKKASWTVVILVAAAVSVFLPGQSLRAQALKASGFDKDRGHDMLSQIKAELKKNYYDRKGRKDMKPQMAKSRGDKVFKGQLVVLVDSRSASAAELFARIVQLERRGTVLGDRSSGAVMEAKLFPHQSGLDVVAFWGVSITDADLIMTDGKSLEKSGVSADETILPTAADLAAKRDPVLARAAELVGVKLDAEKAGSLFPIEWRK